MLAEHGRIVEALRELVRAATEENQPGFAKLAQVLVAHAQEEEEILYPAAILVAETLKARFRAVMTRRTPRPAGLLCAHQELVLAMRSRWTQIFAAVFAALSLAVAGSGYVLSGGAGMQDFARTAASLVQLVLLLTPLTSLVIGVLALAPESGSAELLFSQPVSRRSILLGRLLGLFVGTRRGAGDRARRRRPRGLLALRRNRDWRATASCFSGRSF